MTGFLAGFAADAPQPPSAAEGSHAGISYRIEGSGPALLLLPFFLGGPIWRYREDHVMSLLTEEERATWHAARDKAASDGTLMMAHPLHCAVGTKPQA